MKAALLRGGFANGSDSLFQLSDLVFERMAHLREFAAVTHCYDIIATRLKIDALNARRIGPHLSLEHAAAGAVAFVDRHAQAIRNIGLALHDTRELGHYDVELFGRCR